MVPKVNATSGKHVCLTLRDPSGFDLMSSLANMASAWKFKPLELTLGDNFRWNFPKGFKK
jgi:hypothetical protein